MNTQQRVDTLLMRMHAEPQYPTQGVVLFVNLTERTHKKAYLPISVLKTFLSGRGANMFLLYNLLSEDEKSPLDSEVPLKTWDRQAS